MKKTLVALAVLGSFTTLAVAESNVTLYGLMDESILIQNAGGGKNGGTKASLTSGFTAGSRWGIRGVEDLGGGNKVGFILEQGIKIDTGAVDDTRGTSAFARESALYVAGDWGQLTMGRLGTLGFAQSTAILRGSIFGTTYGMWGMDSNHNQHFGRADNAIAYKTPVMGGFSVHAMYSNKINGFTTDDSANKWSLNNHYYGLGVLYNGGDIQASIIFEANDNRDTKTTETKRDALYHLTLGGQWKLGMITPMALYQYAWGDYTQHTGSIGANVDCAGGVFTLGAQYVARSGDAVTFDNITRSAKMWNVGAAYTYPLSKRTKTYAFAGYGDGSKGWDLTKAEVGTEYKHGTGYNGWALGVGMVHNF